MASEPRRPPAPPPCRGDGPRVCPWCRGRVMPVTATQSHYHCGGCGRLWRQDPECLRLVTAEGGGDA